jgi:methionyl-tRNA formyltransferase
MILGQDILSSSQIGGINIHNGKLPEYRGCHTINWAVANGEKEAEVSLHWLDDGIDTGPIIASAKARIDFTDTVLDLREKLVRLGHKLVDKYLKAILQGTATAAPQNEHRARYYRQRKPEDGYIDWHRPAVEIYNLIRAVVSPWPGAYYHNANGRKIVIDQFMEFEKVVAFRSRLKDMKANDLSPIHYATT